MTQGTLKINTEKLLPIIKQWLYSDKDIFLRELVSNACDALAKLKILREQKLCDFEDSELRINLVLDKKNQTLTISDTGIGMTSEEVEKYIAQLAFSGAEEFLEHYQSQNEKDQVIGHFGLGFYSAYMVASKVEIQTLSYRQGALPSFWSCDGSSQYTLEEGSRTERGTDVILYLETKEFLEESKLKELLNRYCAFLPYPIYLNGNHVNHKAPLWMKSSSECTEKEYLEFYHTLYPLDPDPLFWVHLNIDYPFHLKGILYFPKIHPRFDFQKNSIKLFCQRVFVSDNCQDLLPDYLSMLRGAIDSSDIPLNVSRSYLQMDQTVRSLSAHISKKVADRLASIYRTDRSAFLTSWEDIETIIKLGAIQDDKFYERVKEFLIWKNTQNEWTTTTEYLERNKETYPDKVFYTQETDSSFLHLYQEKKIEVLIAKGPIDTPLINFLEQKHSPAKFQRIDGGLDPAILDAPQEKTLLDANGRTESAKIADFIRSALSIKNLDVEAKSLASQKLPAFILIDEESRRFRDTLALSRQSIPYSLPEKKTFVVNTNSPLIHAIVHHKDETLAKEMMVQLYQLTQLSQKELPPEELSTFITRSSSVLEKLLSQNS